MAKKRKGDVNYFSLVKPKPKKELSVEAQNKKALAQTKRLYEKMGYNLLNYHSLSSAFKEATDPKRITLGQLHIAKGLLKYIDERWKNEQGIIDDNQIYLTHSVLQDHILRTKATLEREKRKREGKETDWDRIDEAFHKGH
jgi:hypothetical protein